MYNFFKDILKEVNEKGDMTREYVSPVAENLFTIVGTSEKLSVNKANYVHIVVRLLFASKSTKIKINAVIY